MGARFFPHANDNARSGYRRRTGVSVICHLVWHVPPPNFLFPRRCARKHAGELLLITSGIGNIYHWVRFRPVPPDDVIGVDFESYFADELGSAPHPPPRSRNMQRRQVASVLPDSTEHLSSFFVWMRVGRERRRYIRVKTHTGFSACVVEEPPSAGVRGGDIVSFWIAWNGATDAEGGRCCTVEKKKGLHLVGVIFPPGFSIASFKSKEGNLSLSLSLLVGPVDTPLWGWDKRKTIKENAAFLGRRT